MTREIKFRAWDKKKKIIFRTFFIGSMYGQVFLKEEITGEREETNPDDFEIMQYTGLKDKNGKEIYEGDILEYEFGYENKIAEPVVFKKRSFSLDTDNNYMPEETNREIIGNIYENPDLIN